MQIVVSEFMDESALQNFGEEMSVKYAPGLVDDRTALLEALHDASAIIVRNRTQVDAELLDAAPGLKVVGRLGVGLDNIDLEACKARNISVCPATGANTRSVTEYVIGTMMTLKRRAYFNNDAMITGRWPRGSLGQGGEISERTLGLLGFGAIAQSVASRARELGMKLVAHDPFLPADRPEWQGVGNCTIEELLSVSDVLTLHVPLTEQTAGLLNAAAIGKMKAGAILINTARGGIIDETALVAALKSGALGGVALDVFAAEPLTAEAGAKFEGCPNLILTPHIAGVTADANTRVSYVTVENVQRVLREK